MVKAFFLLMYVFVALFVLAHVPYEGGLGWQMLQAPVVWVIAAGWVLMIFPRQIVRLLLAPLRSRFAGVGVVRHPVTGVDQGSLGDA